MKKIQLKPKHKTYIDGREVIEYITQATSSDIKTAYTRNHTECGQISCKSIDAIGNVKLYESIAEGSLATGIDKSSISRAMRGIYKHAGNYVWKEIK